MLNMLGLETIDHAEKLWLPQVSVKKCHRSWLDRLFVHAQLL